MFFGLGSDGTVGANKASIKIIGESTDLFAQGYFVYDSKKSGLGHRLAPALRAGAHPLDLPHRRRRLRRLPPVRAARQDEDPRAREARRHVPAQRAVRTGRGVGPPARRRPAAARRQGHRPLGHRRPGRRRRGRHGQPHQHRDAAVLLPARRASCPPTRPSPGSRASSRRRTRSAARRSWRATSRPSTASLERLAHVAAGGRRRCAADVTQPAPVARARLRRADHVAADGRRRRPAAGERAAGRRHLPDRDHQVREAGHRPVRSRSGIPTICIDCGKCAMVCPHATIRMKVFPTAAVERRPGRLPAQGVQVQGPRPTTGSPSRSRRTTAPAAASASTCAPPRARPTSSHKAINMEPGRRAPRRRAGRAGTSSSPSRCSIASLIAHDTVKGSQVLEPLFEFSGACGGCGETPYLRLVSQLFGDRMIVANATGCSSIYGANLPTTPWTVNAAGRGPAWANSLFEDNAEFGLGHAPRARRPDRPRAPAARAPRAGARRRPRRRTPRRRPGHRGGDRAPARAGRPRCARRWPPSTARSAPTPDTCWRSPTTSSARASGSSAATAGPTTSASAASTRSSRPGATSTSWCSTPRSTRTPAARRPRPRRAAPWPSSRPPARARPRRTSAPSRVRTATSTWRRSRWAPTTSRRPRRCSRPTPGRVRRSSSPTAPASRTASTWRSR